MWKRGSPEEGLQASSDHCAHFHAHVHERQSHGHQWRCGPSSSDHTWMFGSGGKESVPFPAQSISDGCCCSSRSSGRILASFWSTIARLGTRSATEHQKWAGATDGEQRRGDRCRGIGVNHLRIIFLNIFDLFNSPHKHAHRHKEYAHPCTRILLGDRRVVEGKGWSLTPIVNPLKGGGIYFNFNVSELRIQFQKYLISKRNQA